MNDKCIWLECDNGYWEPGCQNIGHKRLMSFPGGKSPVEACEGICPLCLKDLFEKRKGNPVVDDFLMELNVRDFHR